MSDPFTSLSRQVRHRIALQLLTDSGFLCVAWHFPQSGVPTWDFDPKPDGVYLHGSRQQLMPLLIMLLEEDRIWPILFEDPEWMELFGHERFSLLLIEQFHDLSDAEHELIERIPMEEALQQLRQLP